MCNDFGAGCVRVEETRSFKSVPLKLTSTTLSVAQKQPI